ncbi:MAG: N-acetyl-gamma-glutamyl-phosphate reductase [Chthoniobacteraceae bacterium]|nr:N-acetyl-gamma-glutamyl-phosphate reductase [Chthoniobacteraceae bacterium]
MKPVKVAVVGASGYSGQELIRILMRHPGVDLVCVTSRQLAGKTIAEVYPRFQHHRFAEVRFTASDAAAVAASGAKIAFLALPHGLAHEYAQPLLGHGLKVIDLSADFRIKDPAVFQEFYGQAHPAPELLGRSVYGLPEVYREQIRTSDLIASPGCYPTSILLPLIPLLRAKIVEPAGIAVASMSGVSGAGRKASLDYLFCECNESVRAYSIPKHRHLSEIEQELTAAAGAPVVISFTPHLVPVNRGIVSTTYATLVPGAGEAEITAALQAAYKDEPFVRLQGPAGTADLKNVVFTNYIDIAWRHDPRTGRAVLLSTEDNLVKGASGQAVQSMNILCGWPETEGL